jgi:hypothetical protein
MVNLSCLRSTGNVYLMSQVCDCKNRRNDRHLAKGGSTGVRAAGNLYLMHRRKMQLLDGGSNMGTSPVSISEEVLRLAEQSLAEGESLAQFAEVAILQRVERTQRRREFLAEAESNSENAKLTGQFRDAQEVLARLERALQSAIDRRKP